MRTNNPAIGSSLPRYAEARVLERSRASYEPCKPNDLVRALKQQGASTRAANETLFGLMHREYVKRTWNGKLKLP
jgi:hypothetical protein